MGLEAPSRPDSLVEGDPMIIGKRQVSTASGLGFLLLLATAGLLIDSLSKETGPSAKWVEILLLIVGAGLLLVSPSGGRS
jgi:hypothetical protein